MTEMCNTLNSLAQTFPVSEKYLVLLRDPAWNIVAITIALLSLVIGSTFAIRGLRKKRLACTFVERLELLQFGGIESLKVSLSRSKITHPVL